MTSESNWEKLWKIPSNWLNCWAIFLQIGETTLRVDKKMSSRHLTYPLTRSLPLLLNISWVLTWRVPEFKLGILSTNFSVKCVVFTLSLTLYTFNSSVYILSSLTLIWMGFLGVRFEVGGVNLPRLKLVRIMLETWNLVREYTHKFSLRKYIFLVPRPSYFCWCQDFCKKISFFGKNSTFTESNSVRAVLEIF